MTDRSSRDVEGQVGEAGGLPARRLDDATRPEVMVADLTARLESLCETSRLQALDLKRATTELDRLEVAAAARATEADAQRAELSVLRRRLSRLEAESKKAISRLEKEKKKELQVASRQNERLRIALAKQERMLSRTTASLSYRLGHSVASFGKALLSPFRVLRHLLGADRKQ